MKVCMIAYTRYASDGRLHRYSQSLLKRGDQVDVIGYGHPDDPPYVSMDGVNVYHLVKRRFNESGPFSYLFRLVIFFVKVSFTLTWKYLRNRYDVIHYHNVPDFGIFCTIFPKCFGAKIILDIHDLVPEFFIRKFGTKESNLTIRMLKWIEKISCAYADHVITVTEIWRQTLGRRSVNLNKCSVIMNLPIEDIFRKLPYNEYRKGDPFVLTYHGNLAEQTGIDNLILAVDRIKNKIPYLQVQIIGNGHDEKRLKALSQFLKLEAVVHFKPVVPIPELPEHVKHAHIAVDPKRDGVYAGETLSVKSMEYLGMGIPLIVSRTAATAYYFDERFVRFVRPEDVESIAEAIWELYNEPEKRKTLHGQSGIFNDAYNWKNESRKYYQILDNLTGQLETLR